MNNILTMLNMINDAVFVSLVNTTLQMTLLIPLIALVIFLFRIRASTTRYSLWLIVIFGLIALPLITPFISQIDFTKFYNQGATGDALNDLMRLRMGRDGVGDLSKGGDSVTLTGTTKVSVNKEADVSLMNPVSVAYFLWCAGALFMLCITLDAYRRLRRLKISSPDVKDSVALEMLSQLKRKIGVARPVALKTAAEIYTPVSLGFFSHTIILPDGVTSSLENPPSPPFDKGGKGEISLLLKRGAGEILPSPLKSGAEGILSPPLERGVGGILTPPLKKGVGGILTPPLKKGVGGIYDELEMFITHELAHIKRCDYLINFLQNMLRAIFFFHPLFYFMNRNLTREREHICDDWVIDTTNQRSGYAECIINLLEKALYQPVNVPVAIAMAEQKRDIPRRIDMIMDKKRKITAKLSKKALIAMLLIGCLSLPVIGGIALVRFAGARTASNEGRIVFTKSSGIWVMDADGKNEKQLTTSESDWSDWDPAWSPAGQQIAFARFWQDPNPGIYIMNADGSGPKQLTNNMNHVSPTWSPDGKQIACADYVLDEQNNVKKSAIYVIDIDGANLRQLIDTTPFVIYSVDWSPDGSRLAFTRRADRNEVWVMDADGNNAKVVYDWGLCPAWSPDGRRMAFCSPRAALDAGQGITYDIYIMNSDGTNVKTLTEPSPADDDYPDWSPDGTRIIFRSDHHKPGGKQYDFYIMDADGSNVQRLTNTPENKFDPDWTAYSYGVEPAGKLKSTWGKIKQKLFRKD